MGNVSLKSHLFFCSKQGTNLEFIIFVVVVVIIIMIMIMIIIIIKVITKLVPPLRCPSPSFQSTLALGASPWSQANGKNLGNLPSAKAKDLVLY